MNYWKEKQQEIESHLKNLYNPTQQSKGHKGRKSKKADCSNKQLISCYAGSLTKKVFTKVRHFTSALLYTAACLTVGTGQSFGLVYDNVLTVSTTF